MKITFHMVDTLTMTAEADIKFTPEEEERIKKLFADDTEIDLNII